MTNTAIPTQPAPTRKAAGAYVIAITTTGQTYAVTIEDAAGHCIDSLCRTFGHIDDARTMANNAFAFFATGGRVVHNPDGTVTLAQRKLIPAARGTQTKVSDPQVAKLRHAIAAGGHINRGGNDHEATVKTLLALARRNFITLTGPKYRPTGGTITRTGRIAHLRASGADRIRYELAA